MNSRCLLSFSVFALGCVGPPEGHEREVGPEIIQRELVNLGSNGPELTKSVMAVSSFGHIAFTGGFNEGSELITIVDSTGTVVTRTGVEGGGPGEFGGAWHLFFRDSSLFVADVFQGRLMELDLSGEHLETAELRNLFIPVGNFADSVDISDFSPTTGPRIIRRGLDGDTIGRDLIPRGDTLFAGFRERQRDLRMFRLGIGSTSDGALIGDGLNYELFEYKPEGTVRFGRFLETQTAPAEEGGLDTLSYFGLYSFGVDHSKRIWIAGRDANGGFLDVFDDASLVGHFKVDCDVNNRFGTSVAGRWIVLLCVAPEEDPSEVRLRLFEIIG